MVRTARRSRSSEREEVGAGGHGPAAPTATAPPEIVKGGQRLGELLVDAKLIDRSQLAEALLQQADTGQRIGRLLVQQLGLEIADLGQSVPEKDAIAVMPESVARENHVVPLRFDGNILEVVAADPSDELVGKLTKTVNHPVRLLVAPASDVQRALDGSYRALVGIERFVGAFEKTSAGRLSAEPAAEELAGVDAPVVQVVNLLITQALRDRASDVHIEPQDDKVQIRYRIDGALHQALDLPGTMGPALVSRLKIMAGMNIVERRRPQDGQIAMDVDGRAIDIRVATVATIWGEKCVLRILDKSRPLYRLGDLGMPDDTHHTYGKLIRAPFGMVICAGPTGSGKTTTLYATLTEINEAHRNIMTIEDPVEYVFPSINQIQINEQAGISFAGGLKSILRQDPDVILVGEVRDAETARIAVQSALTGHFVLSSLHGTDSVAALHRLLDMGIESFLIASAVVAVVGQRLVRKICSFCKAPYKPTAEELAFYEEGGGKPKTKWFEGKGCNFCAGTGYQDRIGVYELLRITPEIKRLVVGWATQEELRRMAVSQGMRTLADEGIRLVTEDVTTIAEVIRGIYAF